MTCAVRRRSFDTANHFSPEAGEYVAPTRSGPAPAQPFDAARWIGWLDAEAEDGLIVRLWRVLGAINKGNRRQAGRSGLYFPLTLLRAPQPTGLPPRSALPFLITLELLLIERAVLAHLYQRLARRMPGSVEELLALKQKVLDALKEYYGAITKATRFSDAVTTDGERLLGLGHLYEWCSARPKSASSHPASPLGITGRNLPRCSGRVGSGARVAAAGES